MSTERARLVEEIFAEALRCESAAREEFLRVRCGDDAPLLSEVRLLLECADVEQGVLDGHAPDLVGLATEAGDAGLLSAGTRVGPYTVRSVLGVGGMGVVYLGEQAKPNRTVALKVIRPGFATASVMKRFEYEVELLGRLQHPGIAQIIEAGTAQTPMGRQPFFAMELVEGRPLTEHVREHRLPIRRRVELMILVCDAVEHAHQRGVVHRDLKPANILVDGTGQPKVLDFGVARATGGREAEHRLTLMRTGERQLVGTLAYMSPEQVGGNAAEIDTRSDVYSLGVVLFELLSGALPHDVRGKSLPDAVRVIRDDDPRRLGDLSPECRGDLEVICGKALERTPNDRYSSAAQLADDLRRFLADAPIEARPRSAVYHLRKFARRNRGLFAGLVVAAVAILAGAVFGTFQYADAVRSRGLAEERAADANRLRVKADAERDAKERESENLRRTLAFMQDRILTLAYESQGDLGRSVSIVDAIRMSQSAMADGLGQDPLSEARLRYYSALILQSNNEFDWALKAIERASTLFGSIRDDRDAERMDADRLRAGLLVRFGRFGEADALAAQLVVRNRENSVTNDLAMQAFSLMEQGRLDAAEPIMRKQFDIVIGQAKTTPLNTFVQTRRLSGLLLAMGKLDEAQAVLDERIQAVTEHFGGEASPARLQFLSTAASLLEDVGEWERATPYRRRAYQALLPSTWIARPWENPHAFVANLRRVGKPAAVAEALEIAQSLLDAARAAMGARSPLVHEGAAEYIRCLAAAGRVTEACAVGEELMAQVHAETADWQYRVSSVRQAQSEALLAAGRFQESEQLARAELARRSRIRGWAHPLTWEPLRTQALALQGLGRASEVLPLCRAALAEQLEGSSMASGATLAVVQTLAEVLLSVGESAGAESILRRALGERLADPGTIRRPIVELRCLLARSMRASPRSADADEELARFESALSGTLGVEHPWTRRVRDERAGRASQGGPK